MATPRPHAQAPLETLAQQLADAQLADRLHDRGQLGVVEHVRRTRPLLLWQLDQEILAIEVRLRTQALLDEFGVTC